MSLFSQSPLALSLSKGCFSLASARNEEGQGFDKLSPNGLEEIEE